MPTGYTSKIGDGQSFKDFVLGCSRAILGEMADCPRNIDLLDYKPKTDSYYKNQIKGIKAKIRALEKASDEKLLALIEVKKKAKRNEIKRLNKESQELRKKYEAMIEMVQKWNPPTENHTHLKSFMLEQLMGSIVYDCHVYKEGKYDIVPDTVDEFRKKELKSLREDLEDNEESYKTEKERAVRNIEYLRYLGESLKGL